MRLNQQKYIGMVDMLDTSPWSWKTFCAWRRWIFDSPDQAGEAFREFIKDFYQDNKLVKGTLTIGGQAGGLGHDQGRPVLNIFAEQDHRVPPDAFAAHWASTWAPPITRKLAFKGGHIGIDVSSRAQREVPPAIHQWLRTRS